MLRADFISDVANSSQVLLPAHLQALQAELMAACQEGILFQTTQQSETNIAKLIFVLAVCVAECVQATSFQHHEMLGSRKFGLPSGF